MIGVLGFHSQWGLGIFLFTTTSRMALGPTQPPIQWVLQVLSLEVKWLGHEADQLPLSSAKVNNAWSYTSTPSICIHGMVLSKYRDNFTFTLPSLITIFAKNTFAQIVL
jgi:hypothetical protein